MNEREQELIAGLADGTLDRDERAEAEALVQAQPELRQELELQRAAVAALQAEPPPGLSMAEAADLRRQVSSALGLETREAPRRRPLPWLGLATAAAVIVALLAVGPLIGLLSTGDDTDAAADMTTTLGETEALAQDEPAATEAPAEAESGDDAASAPATTPAAAPETTVISEADAAADGLGFALADGDLPDIGEITNDDLERLAADLGAARLTVDGATGLRPPTDDESRIITSTTAPSDSVTAEEPAGAGAAVDCAARYTEAREGAVAVAPLALASLDGTPLLLALVDAEGTRTLVALRIADCSEAAAVVVVG